MKKIIFIFSLLLTLLLFTVGCSGDIGLPGAKNGLDAVGGLSYDGAVITWQGAANAQKYVVSINNGSSITAPGTMFSYTHTSNDPFTVTVTARAEGYNDSAAVSKTFVPLATVSNIQFSDDGVISFDPVDRAAYYKVNVDGVDQMVAGLTYDGLTAGRHIVKICAATDSADEGTAYFSKYSNPQTITICGETDKDKITFNSLNNTVSWAAVSGAQSYEVTIQNGVENIAETVSKTSFAFDPQNMNFTLSIRALGNHTSSYDSRNAVEKNFVYLEPARNIHLEDGILYWDEVPGADGYKLRLNNSSIVSVTDNQYSDFPVNSSIDVEIMPICNDDTFFASWGVRDTYKILPAPTLQWVGNHDQFDGSSKTAVVWDSVENAQGYTVSISYLASGEKEPSAPQMISYGNSITAFDFDFLDTGTYFIRVKTLANEADPNVSGSKFSKELKVIRLPSPAPLSNNAITSTSDNLSDGVTISFSPVSRATGYRIWKENNIFQTIATTQFKDYNVVAADVIVEQRIHYRLQSVGKNAAVENGTTVVVLDSLSTNTLDVEIKVLAAPTINDMNGYVYSYGAVFGAFGYNVLVNGKNNGRDDTTIDLSYLESGTYDVKVCARGNGADILASNYSASLQIYRLMSPYDIKVLTDSVNEGTLSFSSDPGVSGSGFDIYINGSEHVIPVDNLTNVKQYITTTGTNLFMRATANRYNELKTIYYMTSPASETLHIRKLSAVTFGNHAFTNDQFLWNASSGAIRYEVYNAQETLYGSFDGTTMQLDSFEGGHDYTLMVKAIGDGKTTFNSDFSDQKSIYKLNTPKLRIENDRYKWNAVSDATSYVFYIDGAIASLDIHVSGNEYYVIPNFTKLKTYSVQVKAVGDGGVRTIDSGFDTIEQQTKQLSTPDFKIGYSKDAYASDGEILVDITLESPNANGYTYIVGGVATTTNELSFRYNPNGSGTYMVGVYAVGGKFDSDGMYYLSSQTCGNNDAYTIKLLGSVDVSNIKLSMDGRITWSAVPFATSYTIKLTINGEVKEPIEVYATAYDLSALIGFKEVRSLSVEITAHGGSNCVSSAATKKEWATVVH